MKRFFDVYMRLAGERFTEWPTDSNPLDGFYCLDLIAPKGSIKQDGLFADCSDGTKLVDAEAAVVDCGTLKVSKTEYEYIRNNFHNQQCDFILIDINDASFIAGAFGLKVSVVLLAESGESQVIKLSASGEQGIDGSAKVILYDTSDEGIIHGVIYASDGVTPVEGALVEATYNATTFDNTSDKEGNYILAVNPNKSEYEISVTKDGGWEWDTVSGVVPSPDVVADIVAKVDEGMRKKSQRGAQLKIKN
jgi:hypothetical protein